MKTPEKEIVISSDFDQLDPSIGSVSKRIAIIFHKVWQKLKLIFNKKYKTQFTTAIARIDEAYTLHTQKKFKVDDRAPHTPLVTEKESNVELKGRLSHLRKVQADIEKEIEQTQQTRSGLLNQMGTSSQPSAQRIPQTEGELQLFLLQNEKLQKILKAAHEFKEAPGSFFFSLWYKNPSQLEIEGLDPNFNFKKIDEEILRIQGQLDEVLKQIEQVKKEIADCKEQMIQQEKEHALKQKELASFEEHLTALKNQLTGVQANIQEIEAQLEAKIFEPAILETAPSVDKEVLNPEQQEGIKQNLGERYLEMVLIVMRTFVKGHVGEKEWEVHYEEQQRPLKRAVKTAKLELSGSKEVEIVRQKSAILFFVLSEALKDSENGLKISGAIAGFVNSLLLIPSEDKIKNNVQLIHFVFGQNSETNEPRLDEANRVIIFAHFFDILIMVSHYLLEEGSLEGALKMLKSAEKMTGIGKGAVRITAYAAFYAMERKFKASINQFSVLKGTNEYAAHVTTFVDSLSSPLMQIFLERPEDSPLKTQITSWSMRFANQDLKELMDLINLEKLPLTTEVTDKFVKMLSLK
ncbi:hypothetical protein [Parachlamydia sp. AcF125]|uniref:hypothetical protein n=1 Tax=Parachlamydia sp. AcF125 TaxID=2795736 RepID=UPI001BCA16E9|nr:hypothetical protein [Parachlamydia sp. AcF125]MBS4169159.1 hypothetical protein [Parachlamydia sp. AcF125]